MKNTVLYALLGIVLGMQATSAQALTYTVTTGNTSNVAGATTIDFGTSPVNNVTSTTGALPAGYTGGRVVQHLHLRYFWPCRAPSRFY